ncbi:MAG: MerR family transcriptional regulator [Deltaproteobacteria bacterium]|nr:MerR family transcriptional regulator [Candidatus Tharpellaceae bacterium]
MSANNIPDKIFFRIGEVSEIVKVKPYVLRYWESEFELISPEKSNSKQRLYQRRDLELLLEIKRLLYEEEFTIAGARKKLKPLTAKKKKNRSDNSELLTNIRDELKEIKSLIHSR